MEVSMLIVPEQNISKVIARALYLVGVHLYVTFLMFSDFCFFPYSSGYQRFINNDIKKRGQF